MHTIRKLNFNINKGSKIFFHSLLFFSNFFFSQTLMRNSDDKHFDSLIVVNNNKRAVIKKANFNSFSFQSGDKVLYENKLTDFSVSNDTLYFFDKVKEIEEVQLINENLKDKKESTVSGNKANAYADITSNNRIGTLLNIKAKKRTFIKSIILFPKEINSPSGKIEIQILNNVNGFPDNQNPLLSFEKDFSEITEKKWEIVLPRPVKYSENGLFLVFYHHAEQKKWNATLRLNSDTQMYMYYPQSNEWKKMSFNGYLYKLRVLQ
ncbi:hypothetical protein [Chryseobacterium gambrini]|uniref:hypothetical protein n=1 Tax=Chryseobacterium gambrini TaxID=373672 RepID=UPI003D1441B0